MLQGADDAAYSAVLDEVERGLVRATDGRREFTAWIESRTDRQHNARERAIDLRALEIRIQRELASSQMSLDMFVRDESALDDLDAQRAASNIREAAELFLCSEHGLPYYYGSDRLAHMAAANVDQFLNLAGDLFEEVSSASVLRRSVALTPGRQEQLLTTAITAIWRRLETSVEDGARVRNLLDGIGEFAAERTYRPNAPYAPGVTGIALRQAEAEEVEQAVRERSESWEAELGRLMATLLAHNLVTVQPSEAKGHRWSVYYLNRGLCLRYRLPLAFGGWQPVTPERLYSWSRGDRVRSPQAAMIR
jgi:hypothetical protein